ncbi:MAG: UbiD family decarboxylase [Chloroflexi bacterium]|nr:UbiD family decarboxylase [Chloroflexota bacterium]
MASSDITSIRSTLELLKREGELLTISNEVNPILEIAGIQKALEGGPAILFDNIRGYPGVRDLGNLFATRERAAKMLGIPDFKQIKFRCMDAIKKPIPPKVVEVAPCQEVVVTDNIDIFGLMPVLKHTPRDAGRIIGGGNILVTGKYVRGGSHISFNRCHFRGKDWGTIMGGPPTHLGIISYVDHRKERVYYTVNVCTPPAVMITAGGGNVHSVIPHGSDELGIAGGIQGFPVELVKAKTSDAYAIAQAEWVIEGYIDTESAWETDEAEKLGKGGEAPFFPEWPGYMGRAYRFRKFKATAVTHRKNSPIFFSPLAHSFEGEFLITHLKEACMFLVAERIIPGLVVDCNILHGFSVNGGIVYQVNKRRPWDEGYQRNILMAAMAANPGIRLVVMVDEDVDIYNADDVIWAITTRCNPVSGILSGAREGRGTLMQPLERTSGLGGGGFEGGIGIDATVPMDKKWHFERAHYPSDQIDLKKWLSDEEIKKIQASQSEYAKLMARTGG